MCLASRKVCESPGRSFSPEPSNPSSYGCPVADRYPAENLDTAAAASLFARNPALVSMIQGKLGQLVGRSSGYIESLPPVVRRRVAGLKGIQKEHAKLEAQFQEEVLELEKKYFAKFTPLYQRRSTIVNGGVEPTEGEVEAGKEDEEEEEEETKEAEEEKKDETESTTGIPEFWLSAMKNQISLAEMITERDEEALKHLTDIRMEYLDRPGFRLIFEFSENEFFTNKTISKTYYYKDENGYGGDFIYDHAEGSKIEWKADQDLTLRLESKKQRNKSMCNPSHVSHSRRAYPILTIFTRHQADPRCQDQRAYRILLQLLLSPATPHR